MKLVVKTLQTQRLHKSNLNSLARHIPDVYVFFSKQAQHKPVCQRFVICLKNASGQMNYGRGRMRVFGFGQNEEKSSVLRNV